MSGAAGAGADSSPSILVRLEKSNSTASTLSDPLLLSWQDWSSAGWLVVSGGAAVVVHSLSTLLLLLRRRRLSGAGTLCPLMTDVYL
jgi:hypothetical protein